MTAASSERVKFCPVTPAATRHSDQRPRDWPGLGPGSLRRRRVSPAGPRLTVRDGVAATASHGATRLPSDCPETASAALSHGMARDPARRRAAARRTSAVQPPPYSCAARPPGPARLRLVAHVTVFSVSSILNGEDSESPARVVHWPRGLCSEFFSELIIIDKNRGRNAQLSLMGK
jgi:hypothetical protein